MSAVRPRAGSWRRAAKLLALSWALVASPARAAPPSGATAPRVSLRGSWVTDAELALLGARAGVRELDLAHTRITDLGLRALAPLRGVRVLSLRFAEQLGDEGLQVVKGWSELREIDLHGTQITDGTLEVLSRLPHLRTLHASHARVTDSGLSFLMRLPELAELAIGGNRITDLGLQSLRAARGLRVLSLGGRQRTDSGLWAVALGDEGLAAVLSLPELEELDLAELPLTPALLAALVARGQTPAEPAGPAGPRPPLRVLGLRGCPGVGDDAVPLLGQLAGLRRLDLRATALSAEGLSRLRALLPGAQVLFAPPALPAGP